MHIMLISAIKNFSIPSINRPKLQQVPSFRGLDAQQADVFTPSNESLDIGRIKNLGLRNFRILNSKIIRGACLAHEKPYVLGELRDSGIKTIIDLRSEGGYESKYAKYCRANDINYFNIKIKDSDYMFVPRGNVKLSAQEFDVYRENFVKNLKHFFELMDEGKVYIGCLHGLHRTDLAAVTNYLLNPNERTIPLLSHMVYPNESNLMNERIKCVRNLYANLTPEHKAYLGIPENYSEELDNRKKMLTIYNTKL